MSCPRTWILVKPSYPMAVAYQYGEYIAHWKACGKLQDCEFLAILFLRIKKIILQSRQPKDYFAL